MTIRMSKWMLRVLAAAVVSAGASPQVHAQLFSSTPLGLKTSCLERHSRAWCLLDAAQLSDKTSDVSRDKLEAEMKSQGLSWIDIGAVGLTASGLWAPPPGFSRWGSASMLLLDLLLEKKPRVLNYNRVFGWMPASMAITAPTEPCCPTKDS